MIYIMLTVIPITSVLMFNANTIIITAESICVGVLDGVCVLGIIIFI